MKVEEIVEDPLYQLNLMLWLLQPLKDNYPLRPILKEAGYELFAIGPSMPLSPELREKIVSASIDCVVEPEPDLLLSRDGVKEFVIIECKRQLFGSESTSAEQSRALLLQSEEQFNLTVGLEVNATPSLHLLYVSKHSSSENHANSLCKISDELTSKGIATVPVGSVGIMNKKNQIYLCDAYDFGTVPPPIKDIVNKEVKVQEFEQDGNPIPIFYIPWDPNVSQSDEIRMYCEQGFCERILLAFVTRIGRTSLPVTIEIDYEDLLNEATYKFYERWKSKNTRRALRRSCRDLITDSLRFAEGHFEKTVLPQPRKGFSLKINTDEDKEAIIDSITKFKRGKWVKKEDPQTVFLEDDV